MKSPSFRQPGTHATLRGLDGKVLWALPTIVVRDDADLIALYLPAGSAGKNVAVRPSAKDLMTPQEIRVVDHTWTSTDVLILIVPGEAFCTYLMRKEGTLEQLCWYINLQEPVWRTPIGYDAMDHLLDVVVSPDMTSWHWKDEDELAEAVQVGYYSHEKAAQVRGEGEKAICLVTETRKAFYTEWQSWLPDSGWGLPRLSLFWDRIDLERYRE